MVDKVSLQEIIYLSILDTAVTKTPEINCEQVPPLQDSAIDLHRRDKSSICAVFLR